MGLFGLMDNLTIGGRPLLPGDECVPSRPIITCPLVYTRTAVQIFGTKKLAVPPRWCQLGSDLVFKKPLYYRGHTQFQ